MPVVSATNDCARTVGRETGPSQRRSFGPYQRFEGTASSIVDDFRDWQATEKWAAMIARELTPVGASTGWRRAP